MSIGPGLGVEEVGGDEEDRTPDLRIANATLSQLSYVPNSRDVNTVWPYRGKRPAPECCRQGEPGPRPGTDGVA